MAFLALFGLIIVVSSQQDPVSQRARVAGTRAPRVYTAQLYLYVLQPGVGAAASPLHPAVQSLPASICQVQITNHSTF